MDEATFGTFGGEWTCGKEEQGTISRNMKDCSKVLGKVWGKRLLKFW